MLNKNLFKDKSYEGALVVFCGFWLHFAIGESFLWGDLVYMREYFLGVDTSVVYPIGTIVIGFAAIFAIRLKNLWGLQTHLLVCSASIIVCMIILSFVRNFYAFTIVYLLMFSLPTGLLYVIPITCAWSYFPHRRGLASGVIVGGFGIGPFIFGFVAKAIINPEGVTQNFIDLDDRIPKFFWVLAGLMFFCLGMNCLFLKYKEPEAVKTEIKPILEENKASLQIDGKNSGKKNDLTEVLLNKNEDKEIGFTSSESKPQKVRSSLSKPAQPSQIIEEKKVQQDCPSVRRGLFSMPFVHLALISTAQAYFGQYMLNKYKEYALQFPSLQDDTALTFIGSFALATNGGTRFLWAYFYDKFGFKPVYYVGLVLQLILSATITFVTDYIALYGLYICLTLSTMANLTGTFPAVTTKIFGLKHGPTIYAFIFLAFAFSNIISFVVSIANVEFEITLWLAFGLTCFAGINSFFLKLENKWD